MFPKLAVISSSLAAPFAGKPIPAAPTMPKRQLATPGLGSRMREETSKALEAGLSGNPFHTGLEAAVKAAAAAAIPAARIVPKGSGVRTPAATPTPAGPAAAAAPANVTSLPPLQHPAIAAARALPGRLMRPMGKALALGALGTAGALAYGMHRQNAEDRAQYPLVYAPMQGTMMG